MRRTKGSALLSVVVPVVVVLLAGLMNGNKGTHLKNGSSLNGVAAGVGATEVRVAQLAEESLVAKAPVLGEAESGNATAASTEAKEAKAAGAEAESAGGEAAEKTDSEKTELRVAQLVNGEPASPETVAAWKASLEQPEVITDRGLGILLYSAGFGDLPARRYQQAEAVCCDILSSHPGTHEAAVALWIWAQARVRQGDLASALYPYQAVIQADPASGAAALARLRVGELYGYRGTNQEQAMACYQEVARLYPGTVYQARAWYWEGRTYGKAGDFATARERYLQATQLAPGDPYVILIGEDLWRWADYAGAIRSLESYLANSPTPERVSWVNYLAGLSYGNLGHRSEAVAYLEQAVEAAADAEEASWSLYQLARAQKASGATLAARNSLEALIATYPDEFPAIRGKGLLAEWQ